MLSLKDFKSFEVNNSFKVTGGTQVTSHTTRGGDYIQNDIFMFDDGGFGGCRCPDGTTFSDRCCD